MTNQQKVDELIKHAAYAKLHSKTHRVRHLEFLKALAALDNQNGTKLVQSDIWFNGESPVTIVKAGLNPHAYRYRRADPYTGKTIAHSLKTGWKVPEKFDYAEWRVNTYNKLGFNNDNFNMDLNELQTAYGQPGSGLTEPYT